MTSRSRRVATLTTDQPAETCTLIPLCTAVAYRIDADDGTVIQVKLRMEPASPEPENRDYHMALNAIASAIRDLQAGLLTPVESC